MSSGRKCCDAILFPCLVLLPTKVPEGGSFEVFWFFFLFVGFFDCSWVGFYLIGLHGPPCFDLS